MKFACVALVGLNQGLVGAQDALGVRNLVVVQCGKSGGGAGVGRLWDLFGDRQQVLQAKVALKRLKIAFLIN